jgi:hypothetical protein
MNLTIRNIEVREKAVHHPQKTLRQRKRLFTIHYMHLIIRRGQ